MKINKKHMGIFVQAPLDATDKQMEQAQKKADDFADKNRKFWRYFAGHKWDIEVRGFAYKSEGNTAPPFFDQYTIRAFIANGGAGDYNPNYLQVVGGRSQVQSACGHAYINSARSVVYAYCEFRSSPHEFGHSYGRHHAGTSYQGQLGNQYGDTGSIMGGRGAVRGLNSPDLVGLELAHSSRIARITESKTVFLAATEIQTEALFDIENQHAVIEHDGRVIHLSLRKTAGNLYEVKNNKDEYLYIHESKRDLKSVHLRPVLQSAVKRDLGGGIVIHYMDFENGTAEVDIEINGVPAPELTFEENEARRDIDTYSFPERETTIADSHSGAWANTDHQHQGFDVHIKNGRVAIYWYTFNVNESHKRFFVASGDIDNAATGLELHTTENGETILIGKCQLYFDSDNNGTFVFNTNEHGRGATNITRISQGEAHELDGLWAQPDKIGEGFSIQFLDGGNRILAYWYTKGDRDRNPPGSFYPGNQTQRWYVMQGVYIGGGQYEMNVYEVSYGEWMSSEGISELEFVGASFLDTKDMKMLIEMTDIETYNYNLERVF